MRFSLRPLLVAVAALAATTTALPTTPPPVTDLPSVAPAAAASLPSSVWRYGRAYPNGLPAARTNTTAYAAPAVLPNGGGAAPWIATATPDGWVRVRTADTGAVVRDLHLSDGGIQASPAVVDWDRDGRLELVVANLNGRVMVWNPGDGRVHLDVTVFTPNYPTMARGIFGTPAVGDLDGDGYAEIVISSWDHYLYVLDHAGNVRKKLFLRDTSWASPAIADVDGNGSKEIVAAWDCDANSNNFECPYGQPGGFVGVFDQHLNRRWHQFMPGQAAWSSPAVGSLQGGGRLAVVLATGQMPCMMHTGASGPCGTGSAVDTRQTGRRLYAFDAATGAPLQGWPAALPEKTMSSPALADVDGDGRAEAFVATGGRLYRIDGNGVARWGWDTCIALQKSPCGYTHLPKTDASPVVGDLMGDGRQLVGIGYDFRVQLLDAGTGALVAQAEPQRASGEVSTALGAGLTAAAWGGRTRLYTPVMLCRSDCYGSSPVWDAATFSVDAGRAGASFGWPTFRGTMDRLGAVPKQIAPPSGAIGEYWRARQAAYGAPTTSEYDVPGGRAQDFVGGRVYWSSGTGAHGVRGGILQRHVALGGPAAHGLPTGEEVDGEVGGSRTQAFQRARFWWGASTGAHPVGGAVLERYLALRGPAGPLGLPVREEGGVTTGGRWQGFANGRIYWSSGTGAVEVLGGIGQHYVKLGGAARMGLPTKAEHDRDGARAVDFQRGRIWWRAQQGSTSLQGGFLQHFDATGGAARYGLPGGDEQYPAAGVSFSWLPGGEYWWSAGTGVHLVRGGMRDRYASVGSFRGFGLPTTDEAPSARAGAVWQAFQGGEMHWSSATGAHPVRGAVLDRWRAERKESGWLGLPVSGETDRGSFVEQAFQGGFVHYDKATGRTVVYGR